MTIPQTLTTETRTMTITATLPPLLLTPEEVARELGRTVDELAAMRTRDEGPPFYRLGGRLIRYSRVDVERITGRTVCALS
jgi:hypothetical protein